MIVLDIESDGLLDDVTKIHCIVTKEVNPDMSGGGCTVAVGEEEITFRLRQLMRAPDKLVGHNIIGFDLQVIKKLYPWFEIPHVERQVLDTLVLSRLIYPHLKEQDLKFRKFQRLPPALTGSHKLEAWGYRICDYKGKYEGGWVDYTVEMLEYCKRDVEVTSSLLRHLVNKGFSKRSIELEHAITWLMTQQEANGFVFDIHKAAALYAKLGARRDELEERLRQEFGSWRIELPEFVPKVSNAIRGYVKGIPVQRSTEIFFNPRSREHIADRLMTLYGWEPKEFTPCGKPKVDESILRVLEYPPCTLLTEYLLLQKRLAQLAEGDQAWLKLVKGDGKIHGHVITNGAVTGRAAHISPNISQVPTNSTAYGKECRELFTVPAGWLLVGTDASSLELRCLAHYMSTWDGGAYAKQLLEGDIHVTNQEAAGLPTRAQAKTFIYAFLYGAGDGRLGEIVGGDACVGASLRKKFLQAFPALKRLVSGTQKDAQQGYLVGLDERRLAIRSLHSALNVLLQSAGAIICKEWLVVLNHMLKTEHALIHGWGGDFCFSAWSHDEVQIACRSQEVADLVVATSKHSIVEAGERYNFSCPLACESRQGVTWAETH